MTLRRLVVALLSLAIGGVAGAITYSFVSISLMAALEANYSGFPSIVIGNLTVWGFLLGTITTLTLLNRGKHHLRIGSVLLLLTSVLCLAFLVMTGLDFAKVEGRRMFIAVQGIGILWATVLALKSLLMLRTSNS